jgi:hypothetical protein
LFTGREWLGQAGIYDYRNRVYSASLGRFLQTDPIRFTAGDVNLYRYVSNTPINLWDPFGLEVTCVPVGYHHDWKQFIGEKYEIQRQLLRAFSLINFVKDRFAPIPDGIDVYLVKWGQSYNVIRQQRYFCTDSCTHKTTVETRQTKISEEPKIKITYSLDIDTSLQ